MKVDMSAHAVTVRLKRVAQLRRLCLALAKATSVEGAEPAAKSGQAKGETPGEALSAPKR